MQGFQKHCGRKHADFYLADFIGDTPIKHYDLGANFEVATQPWVKLKTDHFKKKSVDYL